MKFCGEATTYWLEPFVAEELPEYLQEQTPNTGRGTKPLSGAVIGWSGLAEATAAAAVAAVRGEAAQQQQKQKRQ
jgi:hypothetical protein